MDWGSQWVETLPISATLAFSGMCSSANALHLTKRRKEAFLQKRRISESCILSGDWIRTSHHIILNLYIAYYIYAASKHFKDMLSTWLLHLDLLNITKSVIQINVIFQLLILRYRKYHKTKMLHAFLACHFFVPLHSTNLYMTKTDHSAHCSITKILMNKRNKDN